MAKCEDCGSEENVKEFVFFDGSDDKWLCWDCREPLVKARIEDVDDSESEDNSSGTEAEPTGQTTFGETW